MAEQLKVAQEEKVAFDISEWEEVPLYEIAQLRKHSDVITLENQEASTQQKQQKLSQNNEESQSEASQIPKVNETLHSTQMARQLQNQYLLFDYGKKFQKYKKYIKFEQFFRDNYEKTLYFDPEEEVFITNDGLKMAATQANQIGTCLLYDKKSRDLIGLSNLSYNIEISTMNKSLEQAIQEEQEEVNFNVQQNENNMNQESVNDPSNQAGNSTNNKRQQNTLESIYDWIEKKDKLKQKRIKKQNKSKETLQQDVSTANLQKKTRNPPMNKFLRKVKK